MHGWSRKQRWAISTFSILSWFGEAMGSLGSSRRGCGGMDLHTLLCGLASCRLVRTDI
jgi:hypothetical protein